MDSNKTDVKKSITEAECLAADDAFAEYRKLGATEKKCVRCGHKYIFEDYGCAYSIKCSHCDFVCTVRGL